MIKAILFDCFGVLYPDTYWTMADEYLGSKLALKRDELHDLVKQVDLGIITRDQLWHRFAELVGVSVDEVYKRLQEFAGLDQRLLTFIDDHRSQYKFGMISNVGHGFLERMFIDRPAEDYFDVIVLSSDVGLVKPDRRIYELASKRLDVDTDECVFIDDLEKNVIGAREAGMQAIHYTGFNPFLTEIKKLIQ